MYCIILNLSIYLQYQSIIVTTNRPCKTMKETVNVSIASQPFTLDQDAYQLLAGYLDDIKARLDGGRDDETYTDIEARIAEIFREKRPSPMMVITIENGVPIHEETWEKILNYIG